VIILRLESNKGTQAMQSGEIIETFHTPPQEAVDIGPTTTWSGFLFDWRSSSFWWIQVPHWFLVTVAAATAAMPWCFHLQWRFSLRALLLTMTAASIGLGLIVWMTRR
jgi:hypothetical protein